MVVNVHGRKWGRGLRPFVLVPKVLAVGGLFGGAVAVGVLWARGEVEPAAAVVRWVVIPATIVASVCGAALMVLAGAGVMWRQRWLRVKLALLAVGVPATHVWLASQVHATRAGRPGAAGWGAAGLGVVIAGVVVVVVLGRVKPRLGQDWGRAFGRGRGEAKPQAGRGRVG